MILGSFLIDTLKGLFSKNARNTGPRIAFLVSIGLLVSTFALSRLFLSDMVTDIMAGGILSLTNAFLGYMFIERAFQYNNNLFMVLSLGGMALRFFLMLASIAAILILTTVMIPPFIASFMIGYVLFLIVEVLYINRKVDDLKRAKLELSIIKS